MDSLAKESKFYLRPDKVGKTAHLRSVQLQVTVKPEDMHFEVGGPLFLVLGIFTALWTHVADCDTVRNIYLVFVPSSWHTAPETLGICTGMRECMHATKTTGGGWGT